MTPQRAFSLIELLAVIVLLVVLASMLLGPVTKAYHWAISWTCGIQAHHEGRLEAFLDDASTERTLLFHATNLPQKWIFFRADYTPKR